jgi:hypothetical protein
MSTPRLPSRVTHPFATDMPNFSKVIHTLKNSSIIFFLSEEAKVGVVYGMKKLCWVSRAVHWLLPY